MSDTGSKYGSDIDGAALLQIADIGVSQAISALSRARDAKPSRAPEEVVKLNRLIERLADTQSDVVDLFIHERNLATLRERQTNGGTFK